MSATRNTPRTTTLIVAIAAGAAAAIASPAIAQTANPAQQPEADTQQATTAAPKIVFDAETVDFERIDDTATVSSKFTFRNEGNATLVLEKPASTCGCTVGEMAKLVYEPGESGEIEITFSPIGREGPQQKQITVKTNDPAMPLAALTVQSFVDPIVRFSPNRAVFGMKGLGEGGEIRFTATGKSEGFDITGFTIDNPDAYAVERLDHRIIEEIDGYTGKERTVAQVEYAVRLLETAPVGRHIGRITFNTNDERSPIAITAANAIVRGDLVATPSRAVLGVVQPGTEFTRTIKLRSMADKPFDIFEAVVTSQQLDSATTQVVVTPDKTADVVTYDITISGIAPPNDSRILGNIILSTSAPGQMVVRIPVSGVVRGGN